MSDRSARLLHPAFLAALAVLVVNDHVLKEAFGNALTGKLSDVAGLIVLPVLLTTLLGVRSRQLVWAVHGLVGLAFSVVQFVPESALWTLGLPVQHTPDPTDLLALAVLPFGVRVSLAEPRQLAVPPQLAHGVGLVAVAAVLATSPPQAPLVVEATPVVKEETPRDALRQLEQRLATLGFDARGTDQDQYSDETQANIERRLDRGEEYYSVFLPAEVCAAAPPTSPLLFDLETSWDVETRELAILIREIDYGAGDWQFADDSAREEGRRLAERCVIGPLRSIKLTERSTRD